MKKRCHTCPYGNEHETNCSYVECNQVIYANRTWFNTLPIEYQSMACIDAVDAMNRILDEGRSMR